MLKLKHVTVPWNSTFIDKGQMSACVNPAERAQLFRANALHGALGLDRRNRVLPGCRAPEGYGSRL